MKTSARPAAWKLVIAGFIGMGLVIVSVWLYSQGIADRSVLTHSPCAPPCWNGIVPGQPMTVAEIRRRVEELPSVGTVWQPTGTTVAWYWRQWPWRKTGASAVTLREGMVETIELSIDFALTVKGVVDLYGLPEATHFGPAGLPDYTFFRVDLYYPAQGVEFWVELSPWYAPVLRPGSRVYYAVYTIPAPSLRDWRERLGSELKLHPWPGYGGLPTPQP